MINRLKKIVKPFVPQWLLTYHRKQFSKKLVPPPHWVKQKTIQTYQKKYRVITLIESGTCLGDMVDAQKAYFKKIYSIELGKELFENAKNRFINENNITILQGDSGKVLPTILKELKDPAIFWLDGHYSGGITAKGDKECPIFEEIDAIFENKKLNHIILIDDARCFSGVNDYPPLDNLTNYVKNKNNDYRVNVKYDIIRFTPPKKHLFSK